MTLYMGIVVYAPALALSAVTGIHFTGAVVSIGLVSGGDDDSDDDDGFCLRNVSLNMMVMTGMMMRVARKRNKN